MRIKLGIILVMLMGLLMYSPNSFANPVSDIPREKVEKDTRAYLFTVWGDSYSTIDMLFHSGMASYDFLSQIEDSKVNNDIMKKQIKEWYPHFGVIKVLYIQDMEYINY